ncbi:MAG: glycosyltransferase [Candidatus Adlerbacteria bacterium]|nr:glycosyltransferase [Candidatus Adlerbacteria bacterium]
MRFSIITPAYDIAKWLPETIESVVSQQGDFSIEYILVINDSHDTTLAIAQNYKKKLESGEYAVQCSSVSMQIIEAGKPEGMYVAINQGFAKATGEIFAWIAGDDLYKPGAFQTMAQVFEIRPDIMWLKGLTSTIDESGKETGAGTCYTYRRDWLQWGAYGMEAYHVAQDSVFWRAELWHKAGPFPTYFKSSGDYWLWPHMATYAPLWSINAPTSSFRKRDGQDSRIHAVRLLEQKKQARGKRPLGAWIPRLFFWPYFHSSKKIQCALEALYPFLFPFYPRPYLELENGTVVEKNMNTFYVH